MEFEQYLEKDIITFLEGKIEKKDNVVIDREEEYGIYLKRDYLKEMSYALDNDEITKAKKLFDELKAAFANIPKNSLERKKTYSLLERMYDKIQNYAKIKEGKIEIIRQGDSEVLKDTTEKFPDIAQRVAQSDSQIETEMNADLPISSKTKKADKKVDEFGQYSVQEHKETSSKKEESGLKRYDHNDLIDPDDILRKIDSDSSGWTGDILTYIDHNTKQLNKLKTLVIKKLLDDLRRKLEDANDEHERRIEALRKELIEKMTKELERRAEKEPKISEERLRDEIIDQVYRKARHLVSVSDTDHIENIADETAIQHIEPEKEKKQVKIELVQVPEYIEKRDVIRYAPDVSVSGYAPSYREIGDEFIQEGPEPTETMMPMAQTNVSQTSDEKVDSMYEEAIYTMFQNDYTGAAKILQDIIRVRPQAKAARIRLQECLEAMGDG